MKYAAVLGYRNPGYNSIMFAGSLAQCREAAEEYARSNDEFDDWAWRENKMIYWYMDGGYDPSCISILRLHGLT